MSALTFHLVPNAHLDPVWLWDWREGLNEAVATTRTVLDMMDRHPDLTFSRGEAALYRHIEESDPATFKRLQKMVAAGRWDVVGGTYVQPDTNMPATETFLRHFLEAQAYFLERFGRTAKVAFAPDSFGHSAGLPAILAAAGIEGFAFGRPEEEFHKLPRAAFSWEAEGGARVLAYRFPAGWYGTERDEMPRRLDAALEAARRHGLDNLGVFVGLGNHGGGPTRRQITDASEWAARHPEVKVRYSTLHGFFEALKKEASAKGESFLPVVRGELGFVCRGCYVSAARLKFAFRRAEAAVTRAETVDACVAARLGRGPADLSGAWRAVLFNSFHDILPGSSIERALDEQVEWLGGAVHAARAAEFSAMNALSQNIDSTVAAPEGDLPSGVPLLVFNPHPWPYRGPLELEASLDYRPVKVEEELPVELRGPDGPVAHQVVRQESSFAVVTNSWRRRVAFRAELPAFGWSVYELAWRRSAENPAVQDGAFSADAHSIGNGFFTVRANSGEAGIAVETAAGPVFGPAGLHAVTMEDWDGAWGSRETLYRTPRGSWAVTGTEVMEKGPERALLRVLMEGGASRLQLDVALWRGRNAVDVSARLLWAERSARLKLVLPLAGGAESAVFDVPGGVVERGELGEVPGGRWVRARRGDRAVGFVSDSLYGFDLTDGALGVSVVRGSRYADDASVGPGTTERAAMDQGEHRFRFALTPGGPEVERVSAELERPPAALMVPARKGELPRSASIASMDDQSVRLLALKPAADGKGFIVRAQDASGLGAQARLSWLGQEIGLGRIGPREIATWRIERGRGRWSARRVNAVERPLEP